MTEMRPILPGGAALALPALPELRPKTSAGTLAAHRLYLSHGLNITCHHFDKRLT